MTIEPRFRFPWFHRRRQRGAPELVQFATWLELYIRNNEIRALYARGLRRDQIAARCGVPVAVVCEALS